MLSWSSWDTAYGDQGDASGDKTFVYWSKDSTNKGTGFGHRGGGDTLHVPCTETLLGMSSLAVFQGPTLYQ